MNAELQLAVHLLVSRLVRFLPRLSHDMVGIVDLDWAPQAAAAVAVLHRDRVIDRSSLARIADRTAHQLRLGEMRTSIHFPLVLTASLAGRGLEDDVGDLARKSR